MAVDVPQPPEHRLSLDVSVTPDTGGADAAMRSSWVSFFDARAKRLELRALAERRRLPEQRGNGYAHLAGA